MAQFEDDSCFAPDGSDHGHSHEEIDAAACVCRDAVLRAYREMLGKGHCVDVAASVAVRVLRFHHPELHPPLAHHTVRRWVGQSILH